MKLEALHPAWADFAYACALKDESGKIRIAWGERSDRTDTAFNLSFRQFYSPRKRDGMSVWHDFPQIGACAPENFCQLDSLPSSPLKSFSLGEPKEDPDRHSWEKFCLGIEKEILSGSLDKAVPSRSLVFEIGSFAGERVRNEIFQRLFSGTSDSTYRFLLKWEDSLFFGATPELLFRKNRETLFVPAIAGTRPFVPGGEREAENFLLESAKDRREHQLVVEGILKSLKGLGLNPEAALQPQLLRLRGLVHLHTPIRAAHGGIEANQLIEALHPTPAIGGLPQKAAVDFLFQNEPLDRGLFSSPLLFRDEEEETCLVAIRSGILQRGTLRLFAGAGYVEGSTPEAEWQETGKKMNYLKRILEGEQS